MRLATLDLLRCPFCGSRLSLVEGSTRMHGEEIVGGVLGCQCCAYPIIDGIPVLIADDTARKAMHQHEAGDSEAALLTMLDVEGERADAFREFLRRGEGMTYRDGLAILSVDAEGQYFIYRFSDPTFLVAQALLQALGGDSRLTRRTIDLCGGSGHLTRVLTALSPPGQACLADVYFWKVWLAKRFTAPDCEPVCCDANNPMPFASGVFSMVVLSDAFPYIWQKRMLSSEMMRIADPDGAIVMPHLHSALGENFTAGMTLTPAGYRDLFEPWSPRLFRDSAMLDDLLERRVVDLSKDAPAESLAGEAALALVASRHDEIFRRYTAADAARSTASELIINPLYRVDARDGRVVLTLTFPTAEYEEEFRAARRYLPDTVTVAADVTRRLSPQDFGADYEDLKRRLVLLDAPKGYV